MKRIYILGLCLGFFMVILDVTIVNVAQVAIAESLKANLSIIQWIIDGYTLVFAGLLLTAGHLSDKFSPLILFRWGTFIFIVASLACGISGLPIYLICFRMIQGGAAALVVPTSIVLLNAVSSDDIARSKWMGVWGAIGGVAAALGPVMGAWLTAYFSWRAVFWVNVPIGLLSLGLMSVCKVPLTSSTASRRVEMIAPLLSFAVLASLAWSLISAGPLGWLSLPVVIRLVLAVLCGFLFWLNQRKSRFPMLPMALFTSLPFSMTLVIGFIMNFAFYGELFVLPWYFQKHCGFSVLFSGYALAPLMLSVALSSYLSGKLIGRMGAKIPVVLGLLLGGIGFFSILTVVLKTLSYKVLILPLVLTGFGIAFSMPAATVLMLKAATPQHSGMASGAFNTSRQIGSLVGVALFGTIVTRAPHFIAGMEITLILAGAIYFLGALILSFMAEPRSNKLGSDGIVQ